jgi:hypothetical protein
MSLSRAESAIGFPVVKVRREAVRIRKAWMECMVVCWKVS